ncbi:GTPase HflX [Elysia marginata]|uniref:GTPase HflX n=1 Tax=Elysia marginata TaxID=1093978 RepID=A0AAV4FNW6_9GAST|nr:GTPase HflX [Elysia marginata]
MPIREMIGYSRHKMLENNKLEYENVVLVGAITQSQNAELLEEYLNELQFLVRTAGGKVVKIFTQSIYTVNPKTYIGSGKIEELRCFVKAHKISAIIFDDELTPTQQKSIERIMKCKIIDRTGLILDIFAQRAHTSYAVTQVELAQYEYLLPRLTGLWTHLERQRGGVGMRGPGEREIETDRRIVRNKISTLKKKLVNIDKQMVAQRGNRGSLVRVALVGYTNVGKSTLMNTFSKSKILTEDKLFATLDTTVRKVIIDDISFLLTDTVGFIRKLPTQLVAAFKSTLDEVREADILLHIVDLSHPNFEDHMASVHQTLEDIKIGDKPTITVFNKMDRYRDYDTQNPKKTIHFLQTTWMSKIRDAVFISAVEKENFDQFKSLVYKKVRAIQTSRFPYL